MGGTLRDLVRRFHGTGRLGAIVLRPDRLKDAVSVQEARAEPGLGLIGDHRSLRLRQSDAQRHRELSLIQAEHLSLLGVWTGQAPIAPERLRRNLVISGINIAAMHSPFRELAVRSALKSRGHVLLVHAWRTSSVKAVTPRCVVTGAPRHGSS